MTEPGAAHPPQGDAGSDLAEARRRLAGARAGEFWRSLEELAESPRFRDLLEREFPRQASEWADGLDRRRFLQLASASLALAGLTACTRQPLEKIVPYVKQPEEIVPGRPLYFATAMTLSGYALGLLVESHEGRPTKVEGNPDHPASLGASDAFAQASVLSLYDPDRSQVLTELGTIQTWQAFVTAITNRLTAQRALGGSGIRILTETVTSPTLADQLRALLARYPGARWHQYEPAGRDNVRLGARLAFGTPVETRYDFRRADVVLSVDADFPAFGPGRVRYAREFASRRRVRQGEARTSMSRLYVIESAPTLAGTLSDHRLSVPASAVPLLARALAADLGLPGVPAAPAGTIGERARSWIAAAARDLRSHAGRALVVPGEFARPSVHALVHAINHALGAPGSTVIHTDPVEANPVDQMASLRALVEDMRAGRVELLLISGGNPVFTAPSDLGFVPALLKVPFRAHLAAEEDETSEYCQWHVPQAHELETWSDARTYDGSATILQPLIEPLYGGKSVHELLSVLLDDPPRAGHDLVREFWARSRGPAGFEAFWRKALHDGIVPGTALPSRTVVPRVEAIATLIAAEPSPSPDAAGRPALEEPAAPGVVGPRAASVAASPSDAAAPERMPDPAGETFELIFRPDPTIHDGRFANNGWLQELPKPLSKVTWDNAAHLAPASAGRLGLRSGDVVEVRAGGRVARIPVWVQPGHPDGAVTLHFGSGRRRTGRVGSGAGFDVYGLRTSEDFWLARNASLHATGDHYPLATTQEHFSMDGRHPGGEGTDGAEAGRRHLVRVGTLREYAAHPGFAREVEETPGPDRNLYPGFRYEGHAWGLAVDLNACTGCNACVTACQSENNIPVVGRDQVLRGREMHWLRIDRYYAGEPDAPDVHHQPVLCMHCEQAPCEVVCPVAATSHSSEGLNDMVYNRCVGTRYCSNNCPYKVRRFNFLAYNDETTPVLKLLRNPDVSVRSRGVMEKCTYCVQRINAARIEAERGNRSIRDGEILTACQQACPSEAIVFGDINDPRSRVSAWRAEPTHYGLLEFLNTRPRTTYLAKVRNPNPELDPS